MGRQEAVLRVALNCADPYVEEQVRRVAAAAGAVVVAATDPRPDVVVLGVADGPEVPTAPPPPPGVPVVRVGAGRRRRRDREGPDGGVLDLPAETEALLRVLGSAACVPRARSVAVVGARGGAGASTLAAALARAAVRSGVGSALVDLDAAGGGLDVLLGVEHEPGLRWADLRAERAGFPPQALSLALPTWYGVRVLSGDVRGASVADDVVVADAVRALSSAHDLVVLDVPRAVWWSLDEGHTADEAGGDERGGDGAHAGPRGPASAGGWIAGAATVVVAACDLRSAAAVATMRRARPDADLRLVVRVPGPGGLHPEEVADAAGLPLVASVRTERGGVAAAEHGQAPGDNRRGAVARTAVRLVAELVGER